MPTAPRSWLGFLACALMASAVAAGEPPAGTPPRRASVPEDAAALTFDESHGYKLEKGPYEAGESELVLVRTDASKLPIRVRYPKGAGRGLALLVFSHGAGGSSDTFEALTIHLATHGYVVILPTHTDSIRLRRANGERDAGKILLDRRELIKNVKPHERSADCSLILDSLDQIQSQIADLHDESGAGKIDRERMAIGGHSAGALTAQIAIGVKCRKMDAPTLRSYADERFKAAVIVSGQGTTNRMFTDESWSEVSKPMLVMTGSEDQVAISNDTPASRREPFEKSKPGDKYLVFIEGATHSSYQGKTALEGLGRNKGTDFAMITRVTSSSIQAFLDAYLTENLKAREYLAGDGLVRLSKGKTEFLRK